jgi:hypothetical protein
MQRQSKTAEYDNFNAAMDELLKADPKAVKEQMEANKKERAKKRKAKKSSASARASRAKD